MESVRINYNKCEEQKFLSFIKNINKNKDFKFRAHNPADDSVLQDRYTYTKNSKRVSIVYETKAQTLIITAPKMVIDDVTALVPDQTNKEPPVQKNNETTAQKVFVRERRNGQKESNKAEQGAKINQKAPPKCKTENANQTRKGSQAKTVGVEASNAKQQNKAKQQLTDNNQRKEKKPLSSKQNEPKQKANSKAANVKEQTPPKQELKNSNTFIIRKVAEDRFEELLKKIKANKSMRYKVMPSSDNSRTYVVTSSSEKATVKYISGDIQLIGNRGDLYSELQLMMSLASDYKTAIKSHIEFSGEEKRAQDVERQLKKKLPDAFEFLSEQAKIDLAIGLIDINNSAVVLSDYSTLLIPCFRGLERLIFDLQHAQGIVVKMIGQAYEKSDGNYVLKFGYRRKIPSVIYAEVMAALYSEYYKSRNFYAHSDGGFDNVSRIITDKQQAQAIFNHIMSVINYNGKKLKEIGFRI